MAADAGLGRQSAGMAMTTDFRTLAPDAPLTAAIDLSARRRTAGLSRCSRAAGWSAS